MKRPVVREPQALRRKGFVIAGLLALGLVPETRAEESLIYLSV